MDDPYTFNYDNTKKISAIQFAILGNNEIKRMSAISEEEGIETPDLHDNNIEPTRGGLNDSRLGTISNDILCGTCKYDTMHCPGHSGHILLGTYLFNINFFQYVGKVASCICIYCAHNLLTDEKIIKKLMTYNPIKRMKEYKIYIKKIKFCMNCGAPVPKITPIINKATGGMAIEIEYNVEGKQKSIKKDTYTAEMIHKVFKIISDDDCIVWGMNPKISRPENMIIKILLVPPVQIRPSNRSEILGGTYGVDGLTSKLADMIRFNTNIKKYKNTNELHHSIEQNVILLQAHYMSYIKSDTSFSSDQKDGIQVKSLSDRLIGKHGRVRANLEGKRVNFTARTVITAGADLNCNEIGLPIKIAMILTYPEVVTKYNIEQMKKLILRKEYPTANTLWKLSKYVKGQRLLPIQLHYGRESVDVNIGDVVERQLVTGDVVFMNRQPTLHKQSMMTHIVNVIDDPELMTARLPVPVTTPYNADYDGDEMNIHAPQSIQTRIEIKEIAGVEQQLLTSTTSKNCYGIVQDGLIGAYNITGEDVKINWKQVMNLISGTDSEKYNKIEKDKIYTGNEVFSLIIPEKINMNTDITIKNGNLIKGQLSKKHLGTQKDNGIIKVIWDTYNPKITNTFLNNVVRLTNKYNIINGFSVGVDDVLITKDVHKQINNIIENVMLEVEYKITEFENNPELITNDIYDNQIFDKLQAVRETIGNLVVDNINKKNAFYVMFKCGSKGDEINIGQLSGCLGLQTLEGKLIPSKYNGRTSPYTHRYDDRAIAKGLVMQSFIEGLKYPEFFVHALSSRTGLIESAIKTAVTGYTQRKLVKSMEDISIKYDLTVRTMHNNIIQFIYGSSGANTTKQFKINLKILGMNNNEIKEVYKQDSKEYINNLIKMRDNIRKYIKRANMSDITFDTDFMIPVNINLIINNIERIESNEVVTNEYIINKLDELLTNEKTSMICNNYKYENKNEDEQVNKTILRLCIYSEFAPSLIINKYKLNKREFDKIMEDISWKFNWNIEEPNAMVGCISAQSIGEPLTQLTLKAFHKIGVASVSNTTQGVPRMNELFGVTKNPKLTQMTIIMEDKYKNDKEIVNKIASYIKHTTIGDVRGNVEIYYDPFPNKKGSIAEKDKINIAYYEQECGKNANTLTWLVRIEILKSKMLEKQVTLLDITSKFCDWWDKYLNMNIKFAKKDEKKIMNKITQLAILSNSDNDDQPVIHIRFNVKDIIKTNNKEIDEFNKNTLIQFVTVILDNFKLKGISRIYDINAISEEPMIIFNKETGEQENKTQNIIYTQGENIEDIRYINGIDITKTMTNNVYEMYLIFGIEIARNVLMHEIINAILKAEGQINYHHISLIVDMMTVSGDIIPIDRNGLNKSDSGPLSRASFERTVDQLSIASIYGEVDEMKGVSAQIMTGQCINGGTGGCELVIDMDIINRMEISERDNKFDIESNVLIKDIINNKQDEIFLPFDD